MECGKNMGECRRSAPGICGSEPYIAPEVIAKNGDYDPRPLDVWSCAMVYMMMYWGGGAWNKASEEDPKYAKYMSAWQSWFSVHPDKVVTDDGPEGYPNCGPYFNNFPPTLKRLLLKMAHPIPEKRITIQEALNDRWVKTIECCAPDPNLAKVPSTINAASKNSCKLAAKVEKRVLHNHVPKKHFTIPFEPDHL